MMGLQAPIRIRMAFSLGELRTGPISVRKMYLAGRVGHYSRERGVRGESGGIGWSARRFTDGSPFSALHDGVLYEPRI